MKTVNSDRDLSLPLEKHRILENYYESQEDGKSILCLKSRFCIVYPI